MPRIGKGSQSVEQVSILDRLRAARESQGQPAAEQVEVQTITTLEQAREASDNATVAGLHKSRKRVRNITTGRIRRAKFLTEVEVLRMQAFTPKESAEILGVSVQMIHAALKRVRDNAGIVDQLDRIDKVAVPLAVDNVINGIANGDKEYSLRVLDGRGLFRTHKSIEAQITKTVLTMTVEVTMPEHMRGRDLPLPESRPGSIVGAQMCAMCGGSGKTLGVSCAACSGSGREAKIVAGSRVDRPAEPVPAAIVVQTPAGPTKAMVGVMDLT